MARAVIVSAVRTPFGKLGGGLKEYEAPQLGAIAIRAALDRAGVPDDEVEYVTMGQVLQGGVGQAPARQAAVGAGLPVEVPSDTVVGFPRLRTAARMTIVGLYERRFALAQEHVVECARKWKTKTASLLQR